MIIMMVNRDQGKGIEWRARMSSCRHALATRHAGCPAVHRDVQVGWPGEFPAAMHVTVFIRYCWLSL